jgi:X-X-X-Leu-X-X-Gly heptad repeat protein
MLNVTARLKASGNNTNVYGFQIFGSSPVLSNVFSDGCYGGFLVSTGSDAEIRNASADNCSVGIENNNSSIRLNNVRTNCSYSLKTTAVSGTAKTVTISNSALKGGIDNVSFSSTPLTINIDNSVVESSVTLRNGSETLNAGNSKLYSGVTYSGGGTAKCVNVYNSSYFVLNISTCQ